MQLKQIDTPKKGCFKSKTDESLEQEHYHLTHVSSFFGCQKLKAPRDILAAAQRNTASIGMYTHLLMNLLFISFLPFFSFNTRSMLHTEPRFLVNIGMYLFRLIIRNFNIIPFGVIKWLAHGCYGKSTCRMGVGGAEFGCLRRVYE